MSKKSKNDENSESTLDSETKHSGVNGQPKIGKNEYKAENFKPKLSWSSSRTGSRRPTPRS